MTNTTFALTSPRVASAFARELRVLIILETSGGGSGRHALDLAEGLERLGHSVTIMYSATRAEPAFVDRLQRLPVTNISVPMKRAVGAHDFASFLALYRAIVENGPFDVLHAHSSKAGALVRALPVSAAKIYTPHAFKTMDPKGGRLARCLYGGIERALGRLATDRLIAVSAAEAKHATCVLAVPRARVERIVNGVDRPPLRPRAQVRDELGLTDTDVLVGFVGRLSWQKNPELFLEVMARICSSNPRAHALLMGDGELRDRIFALRSSHGLDGRVQIVSGRSAFDYLAGMDCLAMTSRYEAMPYVMLEALSAGVPLVSTPVGGTDEAIEHGVTGYVAPADPECFAAALARIIEDDLLRRRFADASLERARLYTVDQMVDATVAVYLDALACPAPLPSDEVRVAWPGRIFSHRPRPSKA